jgi:hypothetical protein
MDAAVGVHLDAYAGILHAYKIREGRNASQLWNGLRKEPAACREVCQPEQQDKAMRSKMFLLLILALATIELLGCQRKSFDPALAGEFFPLRPGLSWTYRIIDESRGTTHIFTDRVIGRTQSGKGESGDEVESEYSVFGDTLNSSIIYFPEGGYLTRQSRIDKNAQVTMAEKGFLPQLLKPDLTWSNSLVLFDDQPDRFHAVQTHRTFFDTKTVEVPAGRFSGCIRIETITLYQNDSPNDPLPLTLKYLDWYAPHVGLVKTLVEQNGFFAPELARVELINFGYSRPGSTALLTTPKAGVSLQKSSVSGVLR